MDLHTLFAILLPCFMAAPFIFAFEKHKRDMARQRLMDAERKLDAEMLFSPEPYDDLDERERHHRECEALRSEINSIISRHGIHPFDSVKPL